MKQSKIQTLKERRSIFNNWCPTFYHKSPFFQDLVPLLAGHDFPEWPALKDYNDLYASFRPTPCWQGLKFVDKLSLTYECDIYFHQKVITREKSWHDFFNFLTWIQWPLSKRALNQRLVQDYFKHPQHAFKKRSVLQNRLALFEEGGLIISGPKEVLSWIKQKAWKTLFLENRDVIKRTLKIQIYGHALYEKLLNPYIGLTANALLLEETEKEQFDTKLSAYLKKPDCFAHKQSLSPFPLLGVPGFYPANDDPGFYDNSFYFRS